MNDNTYIVIQSWMRKDLGLSGNELMVYAIIYGFSQDGESRFTGNRQYLADWTGCSTRTIQTILNNLCEQGFIQKFEDFKNNVKFCEYAAISPPVKKFPTPSEKISPNNIKDKDNKSNTKVLDEPAEKPKKLSLFDKCSNAVMELVQDTAVQAALLEYLPVRLAIKEKPIYGVNQWRGLINRLLKMDGNLEAIVRQSIERGWCSFYDVKDTSGGSTKRFACESGVISRQYTDAEQQDNNDAMERRRERGQRVVF